MKKFLKFVPMLVVMCIIFFFSTFGGDDSGAQSGFILEAVEKLYTEVTSRGLSPEAIYWIHFLIRKCAHFTEYAVLGITVRYWARDLIRKPWLCVIVSELIAFLYACTDEFHQYFVPGRYGTFSDVLIDSSGALFGILIYLLIETGRRKHEKV